MNGMIVYNDTRTAKCIFIAQSKNIKILQISNVREERYTNER